MSSFLAPKFPERIREHEANRALEQQILDALLRIEEALAQHFDGDADRPPPIKRTRK